MRLLSYDKTEYDDYHQYDIYEFSLVSSFILFCIVTLVWSTNGCCFISTK